jgi:chemotaxis protein CheD
MTELDIDAAGEDSVDSDASGNELLVPVDSDSSNQQLLEVYLHPGDLQLVTRPAVIRTLLGSCVGITFRHSQLGLAGMCHPMLPSYRTGRPADASPEVGRRYVDFAIREMAGRLEAMGARRQDVEIKLFGGADVLPVHHTSSTPTVGKLNCEAALKTLAEEGFSVLAQSLGGNCDINIQLDSRTGEVLLRRFC